MGGEEQCRGRVMGVRAAGGGVSRLIVRGTSGDGVGRRLLFVISGRQWTVGGWVRGNVPIWSHVAIVIDLHL